MFVPSRSGGRRAVVLAITAALVLLAGIAPSSAADDPDWLMPGRPHSRAYADPSLTWFGPALLAYATNTGGTDLPVKWAADYTTWTARVEYDGAAADQDGSVGYFNDAFPNVPWGINNDPCNAATSGCDPKEMWAPSVGLVGTRWMAYHAVKVAPSGSYTPYGRFCIYASTSSSPLGPFTSASSSPIVCPPTSSDPGGAIDPDVFKDETTGKSYLLWKQEGNTTGNYPSIWVKELATNGTSFAAGTASRKLLSATGSGWEGKVVENPSMVSFEGKWFLLYSGNEYVSTAYATGYAACSGPMGPCTRGSNNPILRSTTGRYGPGGPDGLIDDRGRLVVAYHAWTGASGSAGTGVRKLWLAQLGRSGSTLSVQRAVADTGADGDALWSFQADSSYASAPHDNVSVGGTYAPIPGDFNGDGRDDIFWYGAWDRGDSIWDGTATAGTFSKRNIGSGQEGAFIPIGGDFNGDGRDDIYWYQPGGDPRVADSVLAGTNYQPYAEPDEIWFGNANGTFTQVAREQAGVFIPLAGDFDGSGTTDILWYAPGAAADAIWMFDSNGAPMVPSTAKTINGFYRAVVGNFNGDAHDDIYWYGPGKIPDSVWTFSGSGSHSSQQTTVAGQAYRPFAGSFDGDARDELFFYGPDAIADFLWTTVNPDGSNVSKAMTVNGKFTPVVGDYDGNGVEDVFWYR